MVNKKGMWGKFIAFIPMGATIILYIISPFIMISSKKLMDFSEEIKNII